MTMPYRMVITVLSAVIILLMATSSAMAQGSIFGAVTNSDLSTPANGELSFFGYIEDTDNEIRIESSVGAGYDAGNWFDDFQNYLSESPGDPYDYHFYNTVNGEGFILSKLIPDNSFQQEDISLAPVNWPQPPASVSGQAVSFSSVAVTWPGDTLLTYHVYRRSGTSDGSFFRIDDPSGLLTNPGVSDSFYVDTTVDGSSSYDYLIIAEDAAGNLSPHSDVAVMNSAAVVAPTLSDISPGSGVYLGGTPVRIFGTGFDRAGAAVTIGGSPADSVVVISPHELTAITPAGAIGDADVVVTNAASGLSSDPLVDGFTYLDNSAPSVAGIPDQTIAEGEAFQSIELDSYISDPDHGDADITWTYSGNTDLQVSISADRIATVTPPDSDWFGSETIIFRGTDPGDLFDEDTAQFTVTPINDPPIVSGIPDQAIIGGGPAVPIDLDDYVSDVDNTPDEMTWSYTGGPNLNIDITDRVARVTASDPGWVGIDTIVFRATDPGLAFEEDNAVVTHVAVDIPEADFKSVLVGHIDSLEFSVSTPDDFTLVSPEFIISGADIAIRRDDGGDINADIAPNSSVLYRVIWTPVDTLNEPGTITISSISTDNADQLVLDGKAVTIDVTAPYAGYDFGDVNAVDIRAAETLTVNADIQGNTPAKITGIRVTGASDDFSVLSPEAGDTLIPGSGVAFTILAHPSVTGTRTAETWVQYVADLTGGSFADSLKLLDLNAVGVEPGCIIVEDVVDFGERLIGETHSRTITIENTSSVVEIIDSLYFPTDTHIFSIDPAVSWPLVLPPGDIAIAITFSPSANLFYSATLMVADSASGDCDPPLARGIGVNEYIHWESDPSTYLGSVKLCDTLSVSDFRIANRSSEFSLVLDGLTIDSAGWFTIEPDPASLVGTVLPPSDSIVLTRIDYHPRALLDPVPYAMTVTYHVDTVGAVSETFVTVPVSAAGGCAGRVQLADTGFSFGSVDIGAVQLDTALLTNTGECSLVIDSLVSAGNEFSVSGITTPRIVNPGQSLNLVIQFSPSDIGDRQEDIVLYHDGYVPGFDPDLDCPLMTQNVITCSGTGIDTSSPVISSITEGYCGQNVTMQIVDVGSGIDSVFAFWRAGNAVGDFQPSTNAPVFLGGDQWYLWFSAADMGADSINVYGYELRIIARDREGQADTLTAPISGCLPLTDGGIYTSDSLWLRDIGADTLWRLVSFPGELPSYRADSIFVTRSGMPGSHDDEDDLWRLYEYRDGSFQALTTDNSSDRIVPGRGYWFRHINSLDTLWLAEPGTARTWPTLQPFGISLAFGWNLIGTPYLFPVHIDESLLDSGSISSFVRQVYPALPGGRNWWELADISQSLPPLQPWEGYAVYCENPGGYTLNLNPHYAPPPDSADSQRFWTATLVLEADGQLIGRAMIGAGTHANDGPDFNDIRPLELLSRKQSLRLNHARYGNFIRDIRREQDLSTWTPIIEHNAAGPMRLSWTIDNLTEPEKILLLRDRVTETTIDMLKDQEYTIQNPAQMPPGRFIVYYGRHKVVMAELQTELSPKPNTFKLYQNYPNPFNPKTTIAFDVPAPGSISLRIYDVTGRKIKEITSGYYQAGSYQVEWDGRDGRGNRVASGIYFYRLQAGRFTDTKKLLLLK